MDFKDGTYTLEGNKFYVDGKRLTVLERKKETQRKPKYYLACITRNGFEYISSLYPSGANGKYNFDYKHKLYELELLGQEGRAVLKKIDAIDLD